MRRLLLRLQNPLRRLLLLLHRLAMRLRRLVLLPVVLPVRQVLICLLWQVLARMAGQLKPMWLQRSPLPRLLHPWQPLRWRRPLPAASSGCP